MHFKDYIKGKTVIFVGACPNIRGKGYGELIDSYDVVVRTNGSINLIGRGRFEKDYGKKVDVLYTNNQFAREMRPLPIHEFKKKGVQWLCMKNCITKDYVDYKENINVRVITGLAKTIKVQSATMGAIVYTDLLGMNPKELFLTGVDFFASKNSVFEYNNYREYYPGYLPDKIRIQGNRINQGKVKDGHDFKKNAEYIYSLFKRYGNLKTHKYIFELLEGIVNGKVIQPC